MNSIRVLVANRPRLMRELLLATISDQPDIEIVGEVQDESGVGGAVDQTHPDFLIVALERQDRLPDFCQAVLRNHPQIKIIAIASDRIRLLPRMDMAGKSSSPSECAAIFLKISVSIRASPDSTTSMGLGAHGMEGVKKLRPQFVGK